MPSSFKQCHASLHVVPVRGRLQVDVSHADFIVLIKNILVAVPVEKYVVARITQGG